MANTLVILGLAAAELLSFPAGIQAQTEEGPHTAAVHVVIVDGISGKLYGGKIESFKDQRNDRDLAGAFHVDHLLENSAFGIPYGRYELKVNQPGFPQAEKPVDIYEPDVSVQICVSAATVHLVMVNGFGREDDLHWVVEYFKNIDDGLDYSESFVKGNTGTNIPYGIYDVRIQGEVVPVEWIRVHVFKPDVWARFGLKVYTVEEPEYRGPVWTVSGALKNIDPDEEPIFIRLVGMFVNYSIDDKVSISGSSGTFELSGENPQGKFVLITSGRKGVLDIRVVDNPSHTPIVIDLAQSGTQPTVIH